MTSGVIIPPEMAILTILIFCAILIYLVKKANETED